MKKALYVSLILSSLFCILAAIFSSYILYTLCVSDCDHPSPDTKTVAPTCESQGYTVYSCTECGYTYTSDHVAPTGHDTRTLITSPTCDSEGYTLNYCHCGYSFISDITPPTGHTLECKVTAPTCTSEGFSEYSCSYCGYSFKCNSVSPVGHSFTSTRTLPTATTAGYTQYVCSCSYEYIGDYTYYSDILENAYVDGDTVLARGIDVSRWNHRIDTASGEYLPLDWSAIARAGFDFVIIKAGSTRSGIEPTFESDYAGAKSAGLAVGAYFYTYSTTVEGIVSDAELLLSYIKGKKFEYPIYLDLEDPSLTSLGKNHLSEMCTTFARLLQLEGYYVGLYTNHTWLTTILDTPRMISLFDIWYARYPGTAVPVWNEEKYGRQLGMWQYTQSGRIDGLEGEFDMNYAYRDYAALIKKWGLNGY